MTNQTIEDLRELKEHLERIEKTYGIDQCENIYTINKAIIACEQLRKARKKAKRWKRKYLRMLEICKEIKSDPSKECNYCVHLENGINDFFCDECCHNYINKFKPNTKGEPND